MNQIMRVGKGILIAIDQKLDARTHDVFNRAWRDHMPDVPAIFIDNAQIVLEDEITLFQFTGDVSPTMVAEFQRWWKEVNDGAGTPT